MSRYTVLVIFLTIGLGFARESPSDPSGKIPVTPYSAINPDQTVMNINNLTVWVRKDGFHDWAVDGSWNGTFPKGTIGMVFSEGMLWGGFVNDGETPQLRVGGSTYKSGNAAGAILANASGNVIGSEDPEDPAVRSYRVRPDWDTADLSDDAANFFLVPIDKVTEDQIEEIRMQYEADWNEWPADKGATFDDINGDGQYDPAADVAGISGADQTLWIVYNDLDSTTSRALYGSPPVGLEIQETYWAYSNHPSLNDVIFKRHRIIYKGTERTPADATIDSMYTTQWSDTDVGDYWNDFVGCDTILDMGYGYNGRDVDLWYKFYGLEPPAVGYAFLDGPLQYTGEPSDSARFDFGWRRGYVNMPMTGATFFGAGSPRSDPDMFYHSGTRQFYNLMRGCEPRPGYPDCDPLLDDNGNPTPFELAGDPVTGEGDLDGHPTAANPLRFPPGDRRLVITTGPFTMAKGDTQEVVIALAGAIGADWLHSVAALRGTVRAAKAAWESGLTSFGPELKVTELSLPHNTEETGPFDMVFQIEDSPEWEAEVTQAILHYGAGEAADSVSLTETTYDNTPAFHAKIPAIHDVTGTTKLRYWLSVDYNDGRRAYHPSGAPVNHNVMIFGPDTTAPTLSKLDSLPDAFYLWADSITVWVKTEEDRFPVSVWAKWKVNAGGDVHQSPMDTTTHLPSGTTSLFPYWIGTLRWDELNLSDTIYYWAEAVDSSLSRNTARSEIRFFTAQEYAKIGDWDGRYEAWSEWDFGQEWIISYESGNGLVANLYSVLGESKGDTLSLIKPFSLAEEFPSAYLMFHHRHNFRDEERGHLELRVNDGPWETFSTYQENSNGFQRQLISLNPFIGSDSLFVRFRAGAFTGGLVWLVDDIFLTNDSTLSTEQGTFSSLPNRFRLHHPYPNPFNPTTTIRFDLPHDTDVELTIYDILGREVETLVSGRMVSGLNKVEWYASNVPSGIYFIRMTIGDPSAVAFSQVRKVMVLK